MHTVHSWIFRINYRRHSFFTHSQKRFQCKVCYSEYLKHFSWKDLHIILFLQNALWFYVIRYYRVVFVIWVDPLYPFFLYNYINYQKATSTILFGYQVLKTTVWCELHNLITLTDDVEMNYEHLRWWICPSCVFLV